MKEIQWIVSDLDGTLFNEKKQISSKNKEALVQLYQRGIVFGIASGRPSKTIYEMLVEEDIEAYVRFIIGMNGGSFFDVLRQEEKKYYPLSISTIQKIMDHFQGMDICFQVLEEKIRYVNRSTPSSVEYTTQCKEIEKVVNLEEYCKRHTLSKLMIYCDPAQMPSLVQRATQFYDTSCTFVQTDACMLEFMDRHIHKGFGLVQASKDLDLDLHRCLVLGDADNDIPMFETAGYSLCVKNGTLKAKENAKQILPYTNQEDILDQIVHKFL